MWYKFILAAALVLILVPIATYLVVKFGAAAYFREKQKNKDKET